MKQKQQQQQLATIVDSFHLDDVHPSFYFYFKASEQIADMTQNNFV